MKSRFKVVSFPDPPILFLRLGMRLQTVDSRLLLCALQVRAMRLMVGSTSEIKKAANSPQPLSEVTYSLHPTDRIHKIALLICRLSVLKVRRRL